MTRFFVKWWGDFSRVPASPPEALKFRLMMMDSVKAALSAGKMTDFQSFSDGKSGYLIIEGTEQDVFSTMVKWQPAIEYELYPLLNADEYIGCVKRAMAEMQG